MLKKVCIGAAFFFWIISRNSRFELRESVGGTFPRCGFDESDTPQPHFGVEFLNYVYDVYPMYHVPFDFDLFTVCNALSRREMKW
jgi:hypothetical protein